MVELQYAREQPDEGGRRLVLVANKPLFFINTDEKKSRTGYSLTVVDLKFDGKGGVSGTMAGAARVKPTPDSGVVTRRLRRDAGSVERTRGSLEVIARPSTEHRPRIALYSRRRPGWAKEAL